MFPAAAAAFVLCTAGAASAAGTSDAGYTRAPVVVSVPMIVTSFDVGVAAAHGFKIVTRADGSQASLPANVSSQATGYTTVSGKCGTSSLVMLDAGGGKAAVSTGWTTVRGAVSYSWRVTVAGGLGGTYTKSYSGGLLNRSSWSAAFSWTVPRTDYYIAGVSPTSSVVLNNGAVCTSMAPTDGEWVVR